MTSGLKRVLKKIIRRNYRPRSRVIRIEDMGAFDVFELSELTNSPKIMSINKGSINTDNSHSDCFLTVERELIDLVSFSYRNGSRVSVDQNNIYDRYYHSPKPKAIDGSVFSLISGGGPNNNYYHWLFESIPRLKILQNSPFNKKAEFYYVPNYFQQHYKQDTLDFFGIKPNEIVDSKTFPYLVSSKEIITSTHPNYPELAPKWICDFLRDTFLKDMKPMQTKSHRIFISRRRALKRRILNEDAVISSLEKLGFREVLLEDLTFIQQVELFANAGIVVSPHGAGLANLVFCKAGVKIIEIFSPNSAFDLYERIANHVGLDYIKCHGISSQSEPSGSIHSDFLLDESELINLIKLKGNLSY